jgi:hypothetical protein
MLNFSRASAPNGRSVAFIHRHGADLQIRERHGGNERHKNKDKKTELLHE